MPKVKKPPLPSPQTSLGLIQHDESVYRTILQTSLDGFWINDSSGRILDVNETFCRMLQYSRIELLQMDVQDIEASETPTIIAAHIRTVTESGLGRFQSRHRRKDGAIIDVEISGNHYQAVGDIIDTHKYPEPDFPMFDGSKASVLGEYGASRSSWKIISGPKKRTSDTSSTRPLTT